jgi:hypothetical protein
LSVTHDDVEEQSPGAEGETCPDDERSADPRDDPLVARRLQLPAQLGHPVLQLSDPTRAACGIPVEARGEFGDDVLVALGEHAGFHHLVLDLGDIWLPVCLVCLGGDSR